MTSNQEIFQDYFDWTFSLLLATDPTDPTTRPKTCEIAKISAIQNSPQYNVCAVSTRWQEHQIDSFNAMIKEIKFNVVSQDQTVKPFEGTLVVIDSVVPWFLDNGVMVRGLTITPIKSDEDDTDEDDTKKDPFNLYLIKPDGPGAEPLFVSGEQTPNIYSISVYYGTEEEQDDVWKIIQTTTPINNTNFTPFTYFLTNSIKYINKCCNLSALNDQGVENLLKSCENSNFIFDGFAQLPNPKCDSTMATMCATGPNFNSELCSCINRKNPTLIGNVKLYNYLTKQLNIPEACISGICNEQISYVPANLRRQICPNICSSILNVDAKGYANIEIDGVKMTIECNQTTGQISIPKTLASIRGNNGDSKQPNRWILYVQIVVMLVLIFLLIFL